MASKEKAQTTSEVAWNITQVVGGIALLAIGAEVIL
jgi:hypothetical protein